MFAMTINEILECGAKEFEETTDQVANRIIENTKKLIEQNIRMPYGFEFSIYLSYIKPTFNINVLNSPELNTLYRASFDFEFEGPTECTIIYVTNVLMKAQQMLQEEGGRLADPMDARGAGVISDCLLRFKVGGFEKKDNIKKESREKEPWEK